MNLFSNVEKRKFSELGELLESKWQRLYFCLVEDQLTQSLTSCPNVHLGSFHVGNMKAYLE